MQRLDPLKTTWHITFGAYGSRLHGGDRPTVDKQHNRLGESFIEDDPERRRMESQKMRFPAVFLTDQQRRIIQQCLTAICQRGGWPLRIAAAGPDHVHGLVDVDPGIHGQQVRRLIKRWLSQELSRRWPLPSGARWWAEEGSNKAVKDEAYLNRVYPYILGQRFEDRPDE